ncbi:MAG TPA: histidinol-phosphate transaminase [Candidatus Binatia bacterium]|nr:histidinol-phosphate transaminase [Candidatus Binatia bacterium]
MKPVPHPHLSGIEPYKPGRPIEEVERELGLSDTIKLASNENPLGASPAAIAAVRKAVERIHFYPEGGAPELAAKLAAKLGVDPASLVFGNGSNELIELSARAFARAGDEIVFSADGFAIYALVAQALEARAVPVPPRDHHHDLPAIASAIGPRTRVVFLANPNNPTGTIFRRREWEDFVRRVPDDVLLVVDQAYCEYVDAPDYPVLLDELARRPGLVLLRTFSKIYGLAGLRIGYAVGDREIIDAISRLRQPFNVNSLAQAAALAALDDDRHVERSRRVALEGRVELAQAFARMGVAYVPSQANFVLVEVGDGAAVTDAMLRRGVIVRPMSGYGMPSKIRITFGTAEQNRRCLDVLADVLAEKNR